MSNHWKCPSCFREAVPEVVQIRREDRSWVDSTIQCCPACKHTFGGTLEDRLANLRDVYGYKYFGDYELSDEQSDAVWEAKALAERVPGLLVALKDVLSIIRTVCPEYEEATMCANARALIHEAEARSPPPSV